MHTALKIISLSLEYSLLWSWIMLEKVSDSFRENYGVRKEEASHNDD